MLIAVLTLCDHVSGCPSGDADQSLARIRPPISPPPASHAGLLHSPPIIEVTRLRFRSHFSRWYTQTNGETILNSREFLGGNTEFPPDCGKRPFLGLPIGLIPPAREGRRQMFSETDKQQILKEWRLTQKSSD